MSESDAVDTLLPETEDLFSDSPRRTAPTRSVMGDRGGGFIDTGTNHSSKLFSVVKVTCSNPGLCFGMIGAGSALCLEEECGVKILRLRGGFPASSDRMVGLVCVKGGTGIDVSGGVVSSKSGSFWCTKRAECTTASHGTNIISVAQNHVFAAGTGREGSG
jgi:hypothetical protein